MVTQARGVLVAPPPILLGRSHAAHGNRTAAELLYLRYPPGYMRRAKETDVTVVNFMSGNTGRAVRTVVGLAMIAIGLVMGGGYLLHRRQFSSGEATRHMGI